MATLATLYDRFVGKGGEALPTRWVADQNASKADYRLRAFPNEDVHMFVKHIDNTRVMREADPQSQVCWKLIGGVSAAAVLLIALLLPTGYGLMAGMQIEQLKKDRDRLNIVLANLELQEQEAMSSEVLAGLAEKQRLVDPEPRQVVRLNGTALAQRHPASPTDR
jgi:hypothetical protein